MSATAATARRAIVEACLAMNRAGINQGTAGNVSVRTKRGCLITPSGVDYEAMGPGRIVHVGLDGDVLAPASGADAPSSEWRMHTDIYRHRPEAGAVVHAHPPNATALACTGRGIPAFHYMVAVAGGSDIRCAPYATFGTADLSRNMMAALKDRRACLLANHGMICYDADLAAALALAVEVEALARQYVIALGLGNVNVLDEEQMVDVLERFRTYGRSRPGPADRS